jgi:NAD(P)-dependent dehydrogenase (short-subunit alcohol dehydrogenase family)
VSAPTGSRRTIILTGASSGIGAVAAEQLAAQGNELAVVGRNPERTRAVAERLGATPFLADYERLDDVRALADALLDRYDRIDVLANNAGGHERTIQANHLAPFLLTNLLLPRMHATAEAGHQVRVVSTASLANLFGHVRLDDLDFAERPWLGGWRGYGTAKLVTILFIRELAERLTGTGIDAFSFHPGTISTNFGMSSPLIRFGSAVTRGGYGISVEQGAAPLIALTGDSPVGAPSGTYFDQLKANGRVRHQAKDSQLGRDLWTLTAELTGVGAAV